MTTADSTDSERNWSSLGYGAVSAAAWGFGFLILRVFAVSGYDWDTAFAVGTVLSLNIAVPIVFGDARCVDGRFHSWWLLPATAGILALLVIVHRLPRRQHLRRVVQIP